MNYPSVKWQKHEQGFLLILVLLSLSGIFYVSSNFIFNIFFAIIMTLSTYPFFLKIKDKFELTNTKASLFTTLGVGVILIAPISYVLSILGVETFQLYNIFQEFISKLDFTSKESTVNSLLVNVKLSEHYISMIKPLLLDHVDVANIVKTSKDLLLFVSQNAIGSFLGTFAFFLIALFTMFFLYRDGEVIAEKIKQISPLHDYYDTFLMREMSRLSGILTLSILSIAFLQGAAFSLLTAFMDLNWLFIGVAIALTSFIPVIGTAIVWLPLSSYLILTGNTYQGVLVAIWGMVVTGTIIDNVLRPIIVGYICGLFETDNEDLNKDENKNFNPLNHTLIVTISTLGGIINFGVIGLFIGPIIAGISITVLELYRIRLNNAEEAEYNEQDVDALLNEASAEDHDISPSSELDLIDQEPAIDEAETDLLDSMEENIEEEISEIEPLNVEDSEFEDDPEFEDENVLNNEMDKITQEMQELEDEFDNLSENLDSDFDELTDSDLDDEFENLEDLDDLEEDK